MSLEGSAVGGDHDAGAVPVAALQVVQHGVGHAVQTVARLLVVGAERFDSTRFGVESSTHKLNLAFFFGIPRFARTPSGGLVRAPTKRAPFRSRDRFLMVHAPRLHLVLSEMVLSLNWAHSSPRPYHLPSHFGPRVRPQVRCPLLHKTYTVDSKSRHMLTIAPSTDGDSGSAALEQRNRYEIAAVVTNHGVPPNLILFQILFDDVVF